MRFIYVWMSILISSITFANEPVATSYFGNTAIGGHDTVAYHQLPAQDKAVLGNQGYTVTWKGAEWHFFNKADSEKFAQSPESYAPAYNGHCANALSLGEGLIPTNGKNWAIFDNQLYVFYAKRGTDRWQTGDYKVYKEQADKAWLEILASRK